MTVAVTGMGVVCSIGADVPSFTRALWKGRCGIQPVPDTDAGGAARRLAAVVRGFSFDGGVARRRLLPESIRRDALRAARRSPRSLQIDLVTALEAFEDARLYRSGIPADRVGLVVAGHNLTSDYAYDLQDKYQENPAYLPARFALHFMDTDHVGTLSQVLGIKGEGYTVGGASASGNVGIVNACRLVESDAVDACLVVGAMTDLSPMQRQGFAAIGAVAGAETDTPQQEQSRPFDEDHEGFVPGQGSACMVVESAESARRRGATVLAEIAGYDLKLDGNSLADPREEGEAKVMRNAIRQAGIEPKDISYVNAHATATPAGDEAELHALRRVLGASFSVPWVNSTKGLTGHCLCAAGVVEAVATIVQMRHGFVHPNVNLKRPIDDDCRFVGVRAEPAEIGYALSNSFGFGGFNTSIVLRRGDERGNGR
ncbi:beta-ketoacyl synthase N-terminal-like domain-containing protein [Streptosporangium subroseum]|uniref:beta-ketoacyl synthase N-terminal-like domain-containing protein n=1 Tax=Streptosporangium subroseum TaxID=106412 RepID=UPI00308957F9|nr:hypothetical protein OHB15_27545 [Streptosporangium subroseum]